METSKKIELLEEMLDLDAGSLTSETSLDEIEEWDSMTKLSLIVLVDEKCGKQLKGDDIKKFKTIKDILDFMG